MHLYVATPARSHVTVPFATSVEALRVRCRREHIPCTTKIEMIGGLNHARNRLVASFLASRATHMLCVDADVAFSADAAIAVTTTTADVVGVPLSDRSIHWGAVAAAARRGVADASLWSYAGVPLMRAREGAQPIVDGLLEVEAIGTGFLCVTRGALEQLIAGFPDVDCVYDGERFYALFGDSIDKAHRFTGEDFTFCARWRSLGGRCYAHVDATVAHIGEYPFQVPPLRALLPPAG